MKYVKNTDGIAGWKIDSPIEFFLSLRADKSRFGRWFYVNFYKIFDRKYYKKRH